MLKRGFSDLDGLRLVNRGNSILDDLFRSGVQSVRQATQSEAAAKGAYRFLANDRVSEDDIVSNMVTNCRASCVGKVVVAIQDTSEINLIRHKGRIKKDNYIGTTNANNIRGLGFFIHPSLIVDAVHGIPYGYADIKVWNRDKVYQYKPERDHNKLPIEEKESHKWIEVSKNTKASLADVVKRMIIVQDREGDIYDQFATIPDAQTDLLIRARGNRTLTDKSTLFSCLSDIPAQGHYSISVDAKNSRSRRQANLEVRFKEVALGRPYRVSKTLPASLKLYLIEVLEVGYESEDKICWRLLTTVPVTNLETARMCIEWYSWRWMVEEVFKVLKKEGYDIEASELEYASSVRKLCLMIMEVVIKLFLMRLAYAEPETEISAGSCFSEEEQDFLEHQITRLEGKTEKQKNPNPAKDLKRYVWAIARLGGWKGYENKRHPGITTLWIGLKKFHDSFEGWQIHRNVSTR